MSVICNFPNSKDIKIISAGPSSSTNRYDSPYYVQMSSNFSYDKEYNRIVITTRLYEQYTAGQAGTVTNYIYLG